MPKFFPIIFVHGWGGPGDLVRDFGAADERDPYVGWNTGRRYNDPDGWIKFRNTELNFEGLVLRLVNNDHDTATTTTVSVIAAAPGGSGVQPSAVLADRRARSVAGIDIAPGRLKPSVSAMPVMVDAVPMVMQVPAERAMPPSMSPQASSVMLPALSSAQYFQMSEPEPRILPCQLPRSIGPAGM